METKIKDLFVVYGSESKLLEPLFDFEDSYFIRIYNNRVPQRRGNATDVNSFEAFKVALEAQLARRSVNRIVFIGAAFLVQNDLFISEKLEKLEEMLNTNVSNYVRYCHYLLPYMIKIRSGNFIYLSSFRATVTARGVSVYSASKAFGEKFFEVIGKEYGSCGIYSTSIRLGGFDGRMIDVLDEEKRKALILSVGNRRLGTAVDLIDSIHFILNNNYTNGGVVDLTGGISF